MNALRLSLRRHRDVWALGFSLLVHLLALYLASRAHLLDIVQSPPAQVIDVTLAPPAQKAVPAPQAAPAPPVMPEPMPAPRPKPTPKPRPAVTTPVEPAPPLPAPAPSPKPPAPPDPVALQPPAPTPPPAERKSPAPLDPSQFPDMSSYMAAMRQRRAASGEAPPEAPEAPAAMTEQQASMARIQRNLQQGTNGIFQVRSIDQRSATFSFHGWQGEYSFARREEYMVEAGIGEDIRRVMVRKMIEIIRRYHAAEFRWESPRLGRVVTLSARPEDNAGLEDFLIEEFFGMGGLGVR